MNYVGNEPAPPGLVLVGDTNPIGLICWFHAPPDGSWLRLNGQVIAKATYPDLWAYAQGFLTADQVANPGLYRSVDANTFAVPKLDGLFIRASGQVDANHVAAALGVKQADALSKPTAAPAGANSLDYGVASGGNALGSAGANRASIALDPETRPTNVALVPCVKAIRTALVPTTSVPAITILPAVAAAGTFVDFGIPPGVRRVTVGLIGVSTNGAAALRVQLAAGGAIEAAGYLGGGVRGGGAGDLTGVNFTNGFETAVGFAAAAVVHGTFILTLTDPATNTWVCSTTLGQSDAARAGVSGGSKALAGMLDRVRVTTANGTDAFDLGKLGVMYE